MNCEYGKVTWQKELKLVMEIRLPIRNQFLSIDLILYPQERRISLAVHGIFGSWRLRGKKGRHEAAGPGIECWENEGMRPTVKWCSQALKTWTSKMIHSSLLPPGRSTVRLKPCYLPRWVSTDWQDNLFIHSFNQENAVGKKFFWLVALIFQRETSFESIWPVLITLKSVNWSWFGFGRHSKAWNGYRSLNCSDADMFLIQENLMALFGFKFLSHFLSCDFLLLDIYTCLPVTW